MQTKAGDPGAFAHFDLARVDSPAFVVDAARLRANCRVLAGVRDAAGGCDGATPAAPHAVAANTDAIAAAAAQVPCHGSPAATAACTPSADTTMPMPTPEYSQIVRSA
jgi:hypothetical protein